MKTPKTQQIALTEIRINPKNPRIVKDQKFKELVKSIKEFPEMLMLRPVVLNGDKMLLGGDKRFKAAKEAGMKTIPAIIVTDLTEKQQKEFIIKDNLHAGDWSLDMLDQESDWDKEELKGWGLDMGDHEEEEELVFGKNRTAEYPIVPEADEKYDCIMIICKSNTDSTFIKSVLDISREKSYKNEYVGESNVISSENFIEKWNSK